MFSCENHVTICWYLVHVSNEKAESTSVRIRQFLQLVYCVLKKVFQNLDSEVEQTFRILCQVFPVFSVFNNGIILAMRLSNATFRLTHFKLMFFPVPPKNVRKPLVS